MDGHAGRESAYRQEMGNDEFSRSGLTERTKIKQPNMLNTQVSINGLYTV